MGNELINMDLWEGDNNLKEIKAIFAPKLNENEFKAFIGMGRASGLNPFLREIWAVKYDEKAPAQIFIGRDGYRKSMQQNPDYDYHHVHAVYSNDDFKVENGEVTHSYGAANRGQLLGAYCLVFKKSSSRPIYVYVPLADYDKGQSCWKTMKDTMIKKVAEAQCSRMAFQEQFAGTLSEAEEYITINGEEFIVKKSQADRINSLLTKKGFNNNANKTINVTTNSHSVNTYSVDGDGVLLDENKNVSPPPIARESYSEMVEDGKSENSSDGAKDEFMPCTSEQLESISLLIHEKQVDKAGQLKCLDHFHVTDFSELSERQASAVIKKLSTMEIPMTQ
jgi:phage recombination protein Bet